MPTCDPNVMLKPNVSKKVMRNAVQDIKNGKAERPEEVMADLVKVLNERDIKWLNRFVKAI